LDDNQNARAGRTVPLGCLAIRWALVLVMGSVVQFGGIALASVNLPTHHWAYEAIERLTAMGVIDHAIVVTKPYSRKQAAQYVAQALQRASDNPEAQDGQEEVTGPLLDRLVREFRPELVDIGALPGNPRRGLLDFLHIPGSSGAKTNAVRYGGRLQVEGDAFFVGHQTVRLRENRGGEYYANGEQIQTDVRGWIELGDAISIVAQPKYISNPHVLGIGATNNTKEAYLRELNVKFTLANISLEVGRGMQWWGPGYHGSLLLTDHAFPLDMIKLGSEEPFRLPWVFRDLGEWKINTFLTQLDRDRDFPRAKVFGLRISYSPTSWLELGLTRLTQFNGRGRDQSFPDAVLKAYFSNPNTLGGSDVNEQAMIDFRAKVPHINYLVPFPSGLQLYGEIGSEDKWSKFPLPTQAAVLGGIYIPQVFRGDSLDLRFEYADTDLSRRRTNIANVWYNNFLYQSGMRYRGFPLGHWMGADATDYFLRATRHMTDDLVVGVNLDYSQRGMSLPQHEKKREAAVDVTWWLTGKTQLTVGYTYQHIQNPGQITSINPFQETFASGVLSENSFFWTNLAWEF
jgi:hypothetical protein